MKDKKNQSVWTNIKLVGMIIPTILILMFFFFLLTRNEILMLSKDRLASESQNCADAVSAWTERTLAELDIYQSTIAQMGFDNEDTFALMDLTFEVHETYPNGLYWGDSDGNYYDASGWIPDEDFIVTERNWYKEGLGHSRFAFGKPYLDAMTGNTCVSATVKLEDKAGNVSVLAADVYLDYAVELAAEIIKGSIEEAYFVEDETRTILAASDPQTVGMALNELEDTLLFENISQLLSAGRTGQSEVKGCEGTYFVDINWIKNTSWYFVTCISSRAMLKNLHRMEMQMVAAAVIATLVLAAVTIRVAAEMSAIRRKAKTDPLTKLLNREGFREIVMMSLEAHPDQGLLLMIDMDNFKQVNDQLGHPVGDRVLKRFAFILEEYFNRNKDVVSRVGGDEFAVFVGRAITEPDAEVMLKKFITLVYDTFQKEYPEQKLSASVGGAFVRDGSQYEVLYQNADTALYEAKRNGKNCFRIGEKS